MSSLIWRSGKEEDVRKTLKVQQRETVFFTIPSYPRCLIRILISVFLKGQCLKIFYFRFIHKSCSPRPPIIVLTPFQMLLKIHEDIRN